jgi:type III pantothenate kinase
MKLILDIGNTRTKVGIFDAERLIHFDAFPSQEIISRVSLLKNSYNVTHALYCQVGAGDYLVLTELQAIIPTHRLSHTSRLPFGSVCTPFTSLGLDRIGLMAAAVKNDKHPVLVIDAGTCVTYDIMDSQKTHLGGVISPGLSMRYRAMHEFTANLPQLTPIDPDTLTGTGTQNAMHIGAVIGLASELDGFIESYRAQYRELTVILTGGDAEFLRVRIKNDIFAHSNFLLEGLNFILDLNLDSCSGKSSSSSL